MRGALAHPVPARQTDLAIQLHGMNLPTLPVTGKGSQTGRVLLRRSGTVPPLPWSTFAPPLTAVKGGEKPDQRAEQNTATAAVGVRWSEGVGMRPGAVSGWRRRAGQVVEPLFRARLWLRRKL